MPLPHQSSPDEAADVRGYRLGLREARLIRERRDLSVREVDESINRRVDSCLAFAEQYGASHDAPMVAHFKACADGFIQALVDIAADYA